MSLERPQSSRRCAGILTILVAVGLVPLAGPALAGASTETVTIQHVWIGGVFESIDPDGWTCSGFATADSHSTVCSPDAHGTYRCRVTTVETGSMGVAPSLASGASYCSSPSSSVNAACFVLHGPPVDVCSSTAQGGDVLPFICVSSWTDGVLLYRVECTMDVVVVT